MSQISLWYAITVFFKVSIIETLVLVKIENKLEIIIGAFFFTATQLHRNANNSNFGSFEKSRNKSKSIQIEIIHTQSVIKSNQNQINQFNFGKEIG